MAPTPGWCNLDNSFSVRAARFPGLAHLARRVGLIDYRQYEFIQFIRRSHITYADVKNALPFEEGSVEVLYSSHMLEHLDRKAAGIFLSEAYRVLKEGGVIRLVVPDLSALVTKYTTSGDADNFVASLFMSQPFPVTWQESIRQRVALFRDHRWMYDGHSLSSLLRRHGFVDTQCVTAGETRIVDPGDLDLRERECESVYVEAYKP